MKAGKREKRRVPKPHRTWAFEIVDKDDGSIVRSLPMEHEDIAYMWLRTGAVLFCSDEAEAKVEGQRRLKQAAKIMAEWEAREWNRKPIAKLDRPGAKSALREKIIRLMRTYRDEDTDFQTFLAAWQAGAQEGLRLTTYPIGTHPTGLEVTDEDVLDENGDFVERAYAVETLRKMFSEAGRNP